jgi:hypothetical protein
LVSIILLLVLIIVGCSSSESSSTTKDSKNGKSSKVTKEAKVLTKDEYTKMFSDPKKYKGSKVEFYAKIFVDPEKDDKGTYIQAYADNNQDRNIIIAIKDPNLDVKNEDIVHVSGTVNDEFKGKNALGGEVTAPSVVADKVEKSEYATAFAPALKTIDVNKNIDQHGYVLNISKIELAENETRVYVDITNNTKNTINFYDFNSKLILNNQQLEPSDNYDANYQKIQSDILPGVKTQGIIAFPKVPQSGSLKVYMEGASQDYNLDFQPFQFDVNY